MTKIFSESFFDDFWCEDDYTYRDYTGEPLRKEQVPQAEETLGYKLPPSYIELLENKNGGVPNNLCFPTKKKTSWAEDHIQISAIHGINKKDYSLLGSLGSRFMQDEWGYPDIGIVICDSPSAGHDAVMLDYRQCKNGGEPAVIHVDVEVGDEPEITYLADNFESFVRGLVNESVYEPTAEEEMQELLNQIATGSFSPVLLKAFETAQNTMPDVGQKLRRLAKEIVMTKQVFALHEDDLSYLMYDYLFWLFCHVRRPQSMRDYLWPDKDKPMSYDTPYYALMVALSDGQDHYEFHTAYTGGYCRDFLKTWWQVRQESGELIETPEGFTLSQDATKKMFDALANYQ